MECTSKLLHVLLLVVLVSTPAGANDEDQIATDQLKVLRERYERLTGEVSTVREELNARYQKGLKKLEKKAQGDANLKLVLAIRTEEKMFRARERSAESRSLHPELARLQEIYDDQKTQLVKDKLASIVTGYRKQLSALKRERTRKGDIAGAVAVQSEIERLGTAYPSVGRSVRGRYVRISLPEKSQTLQFAELELFDPRGRNLAIEGRARQSGTAHKRGDANHGIDGNKDGEVMSNSIVLSDGLGCWWEVDLRGEKDLSRLVFWSRNGHQDRMDGMKLSILDARREPVWERIIPKAPRRELEIVLSGD